VLAAPSSEESADAIDLAIERRRSRLNYHQILGIGTEVVGLGSFAVSLLDDRDRFGGGGRTGGLRTLEISLDVGAELMTIGTYLFAVRPTLRQGQGLRHQYRAPGVHVGAAFFQVAKIVLSALLFNAHGPSKEPRMAFLLPGPKMARHRRGGALSSPP
jgi:hypothetical protein